MGAMLTRAIDEAGFARTREHLLAGESLAADELERLRRADLLVVAGLADLVRRKFRGDEVRVISGSVPREPELHVFASPKAAVTGAEVLRELALTRLRIPAGCALAVSFDELGVELAQTALVFGADVLFGDLLGKRTLPLLDGPEARRVELRGLIERSGRSAVFGPSAGSELEQRS